MVNFDREVERERAEIRERANLEASMNIEEDEDPRFELFETNEGDLIMDIGGELEVVLHADKRDGDETDPLSFDLERADHTPESPDDHKPMDLEE